MTLETSADTWNRRALDAEAEVTRLREVVRITEIQMGTDLRAEQEAKEEFQHERDDYYDQWRAAESRLARTQEAVCEAIARADATNKLAQEYSLSPTADRIQIAARNAQRMGAMDVAAPLRRLAALALPAETKETRKQS